MEPLAQFSQHLMHSIETIACVLVPIALITIGVIFFRAYQEAYRDDDTKNSDNL